MVEVGKCRIEPDKDRRVAQILATDVTREQLAETVWSMERTHAVQHDLIMELMDSCNHLKDRNYELRDLIIDMSPDVFVACEMCESGGDVRRCRDVSCRFKQFHDRMRWLEIEVTP